jgi:hypothetical protein
MKLILLGILLSAASFAASLPDTFRYQILTTDKTTSTVTQGDFVIIPHVIAGLFHQEAKNLVVNVDWDKPYFTAWASKNENSFALNFWGGLARIPGMNPEAHALIACHELGHVIGGTPKIKIKDFLWSSAEGQSDFFATSVCLKRYFRHVNTYQKLEVPRAVSETAYTLCRTTYAKDLDFKVCLHSMKGIEAFTKVLSHLSQYEENPSIATPDASRVKVTLYDSYPSRQCRIDTLAQGSLGGERPSCWFVK